MSIQIIKQNIKIDPKTGCWNWQKSLSSSGYGQKRIDGIQYNNIHRYVYSLYNEIGPKEVVRHKCHNRACCNPEHLINGSRLDNYRDSVNVHKQAAKRRREKWICNGVYYETIRDMQAKTGISSPTILKHTNKEGIFDVDSYRRNCYSINMIPKV